MVDKYIDEPHTTFIPVTTGKSSVLGVRYFKILCVVLLASFLVACHQMPTRTKRKYILVISGYAGNKHVEETFEVTAEEYKHYEIGNTFIQDAVLENKEEDK